jgi:hypothetical protein
VKCELLGPRCPQNPVCPECGRLFHPNPASPSFATRKPIDDCGSTIHKCGLTWVPLRPLKRELLGARCPQNPAYPVLPSLPVTRDPACPECEQLFRSNLASPSFATKKPIDDCRPTIHNCGLRYDHMDKIPPFDVVAFLLRSIGIVFASASGAGETFTRRIRGRTSCRVHPIIMNCELILHNL